MQLFRGIIRRPGSYLLAVLAAVCCGNLPQAAAVNPDSAEVRDMVEKGLKYLTTANHDQIGGKCLIARAFKKNGRDTSFPKVKAVIDECYKTKFEPHAALDNYNLALMIIFLVEMEEEKHRPLIQKMLTELLKRQKANGGWTYEPTPTGDTSQTQYGVLAMWYADRHNYDVPMANIEGAMNWLLRTQDKLGGWGYQGQDSGKVGVRVDQSTPTMSLTAAALGSLYALNDLVVLPGGNPVVDPAKAGEKIPPALQEVEDKKIAKQVIRRRPSTTVDGGQVRKSMQDGKQWMQKGFTLEPPEWAHYAFYAYERYESFREEIERDRHEEPKWYDDLYGKFKKDLLPEGYWDGSDTPAVATAFTILVLSRGTRKAIKRAEALGEGTLVGGMGLPPNTENMKERNGKLVDSPLTGTVDELLGILDDKDNPELARMAESKQVVSLDPDITRRAGQITRLRAMVSAPSFETRLVAVRSLAKVRDLDNVPVLLYALSDPDIRIIRAADRGLRFNSRKLEGVMPLDTPTKETLISLRNRWKQWYLSIRPDAELLD